jgi:hypothetical protein
MDRSWLVSYKDRLASCYRALSKAAECNGAMEITLLNVKPRGTDRYGNHLADYKFKVTRRSIKPILGNETTAKDYEYQAVKILTYDPRTELIVQLEQWSLGLGSTGFWQLACPTCLAHGLGQAHDPMR